MRTGGKWNVSAFLPPEMLMSTKENPLTSGDDSKPLLPGKSKKKNRKRKNRKPKSMAKVDELDNTDSHDNDHTSKTV